MDYAALSYTWGEARKPYDIVVNGGRLAVTENLHLALRHLRYQDQDRILWIDAICKSNILRVKSPKALCLRNILLSIHRSLCTIS